MQATIVDYDRGNLFSVQKALEHCGATVDLTGSAERIAAADRLILPGVGAFGDAVAELERRDLIEPIRTFARSGRPLLGICLGMQLMFDESEEFGVHRGLGIIAGRVAAIPKTDARGGRRKVPHIGWSRLVMPSSRNDWSRTILANLPQDASCYFVHSFSAIPAAASSHLADCIVDDYRVSAAVQNDNLWGCQFHPEKSGEIGLQILRNFLAFS